MQVHETNLKQLVQGEKQFRVPLWQRQYTWQIADHRLLWRDILEQYAQASDPDGGTRSGHFLGSIVLSPVPSAASEIASYLIVDGQQRLTTLMLLLAASGSQDPIGQAYRFFRSHIELPGPDEQQLDLKFSRQSSWSDWPLST